MARTALFGAVRRALIRAGAGAGPRALSRRAVLGMGVGLAACQGFGRRVDIAIVGAGAAGLSAAYKLSRAGRRVSLYEASGRFGGRMLTRREFNADGQFCELGGELVDTDHTALRTLAAELNVAIQPLGGEHGEDVYHIGGRRYTQRDMLDPATGRGAFAALAQRIATDQQALLDEAEEWTARARALDQMSLHDYLASHAQITPRWALEALEIAYHGEFGLPTREQSALNLVDFIGVEARDGFKIFGDSDEAFRIAGGSSSLIEALAARLAGVRREMAHALSAIGRRENGSILLGFDAPGGQVERAHDIVILALPFTKLRQVAGVDTLGLGAEQLRAIRELGYGDNAKLMISTEARPWADSGVATLYSDQFQALWETSRGQPGARGVLTNFLAGRDDREAAIAALRAGLSGPAPATLASLDESTTAFMAWARQPFALGSYSAPRVGQYTTLLEHIGAPSEDGRIHFAGEHASVDHQGYMNGAVETGLNVAAALGA